MPTIKYSGQEVCRRLNANGITFDYRLRSRYKPGNLNLFAVTETTVFAFRCAVVQNVVPEMTRVFKSSVFRVRVAESFDMSRGYVVLANRVPVAFTGLRA